AVDPHQLSPDPSLTTALTRPTAPLVSRTLMPCGWVGEEVRMSRTMPRVLLPVAWSCLRTISTASPGWMSCRRVPSMAPHCSGAPLAKTLLDLHAEGLPA